MIRNTNIDDTTNALPFAKPMLADGTGLNVLSLFDGMSCGQIALEKSWVKVNKYFASEIEKEAIKVTVKNYPNTIQIGNVVDVDVKLLCLSEVYSYLCTYDTNLQSKISEQEVLYWINEEYTFSTDFGTQKQNEGQEVQQYPILQCFEKIRITKCGMGGFIKARNIKGCGIDGDKANIGNPLKLQCGEWWYGNDIQSRDTQTNIGGAKGEVKNSNLQTENIRNPQGKISKRERTQTDFRENKKGNVDKESKGELFARSEENKFNGKVREEEGNGGVETDRVIENLIRKLHEWNETNGTSGTYRDFLRLHSQEQITVVKYAGGLKVFKGKFDLICGGSPCQSFSNAGKGDGFDGKSKLFWEYVRILKEVKPTYFLLENVKMKKEWQDIITEALGVEPIEINSKFFVPQNRPRLYWTNIKFENTPTKFNHCINDILEDASNEYYLTEKQKSILDLDFKWSENEIIRHKAGKHQQDNIFRYDGIMGCLSASTHGAARHLTKTYLPNREIRRLTENEVEKLQGIPINYTDNVSSSKRYEMLGNGWTVDVIAHIFGGLS